MNELKPCPFCGGDAKLLIRATSSRGDTRGWEFGIYCESCGTSTPKTNYWLELTLDAKGGIVFRTDERRNAVDAWNTRAVDIIRCSECQWWQHAGCAIDMHDDSDKPTANDFCSFGERKNEHGV